MKKIAVAILAFMLLGILAQGPSMEKTSASGTIPVLGNDSGSGRVFEDNGVPYVLWGVDADTWGCEAGNTALFEQHCQSVAYVNGNCIAIPITWKCVEPLKDVYTFTAMDNFIALAASYGLKATVLWIGIDYAAGDYDFCPPYILNTPATYQRITGTPFTVDTKVLCPSDPDTQAREKAAYYKMMQHLGSNNSGNTVMAVNCGGETDFMRALPGSFWNQKPEQDIRCTCPTCNVLYANQGNLVFMEQQYSNYIKMLIDYGKTIYDIPVYTQVCAYDFYTGWRYAENAPVIKSTVNRTDHFVVPSVANTSSVAAYVSEMDHFLPSSIPGNLIFTDGIDTEWSVNQSRIEIAPWFNTLWYGGLGALYWDSPNKSIRTDNTLREKLRKYWGPLKGIQDKIARYKTSSNKFWWYPDGNTHSWGSTGNFAVDRVSSSEDYGVCFELGSKDICFTASTYGGEFTFTTARSGGYAGFRFEKGSFSPTTGEWIKTGDVTPSINGDRAVLTVSADSGDSSSAVYRYYYVPEVVPMLEYKVVFNSNLSNAGDLLVDVRSMNGYGAFSNITVNPGDKLSYEVYIPSYGNYRFGMGALDGQYAPSWSLIRAQDPRDQYGLTLYCGLLDTFDTDTWILREIPLSVTSQSIAHIGPGMLLHAPLISELAGKTAKIYYRNIKIIHANNTVENIVPDNGTALNSKMEGNIDTGFGTVTLTSVTTPEITFGTLKVNRGNILTGSGTGKKVSDMKNTINGSSGYSFKDKDGNLLTDSGKIGTGTTADLAGNATTTHYSFLIKGDLTGDGEVKIDDLSLIRKHLLKIDILQGLWLEAGDFYDTDSIAVSNLLTLKKALVGTGVIPG